MHRPRRPASPIDPANDTAVFQFTGGTSGLPKAAELTHRNLVANVAQIGAWVPSLRPWRGEVSAWRCPPSTSTA
jgi:long-chain acyl-CoA synthetase